MKLRYDVGDAVNKPKDLYQRKRPYLIDEGPICVDKTEGLAKSPDYPSGHTTWGWTVGLVLAEADPAHATPILTRGPARSGRAGWSAACIIPAPSRPVAPMASALVAALHGSKAFRDDLDAVRDEIAEAPRHRATAPAQCDVEAALIAKSPY
jgi:acid phosphatase (class A)